jgi:predicted nucleic acid-binding protein
MSRDRFRVVLDTNVVFEGVTRKAGSCGTIVDAWLAERLRVFVSDALAYEYVEVLSRKLSIARWQAVKVPLRTLLGKAEFVPIRYSWRPTSPDPGDEMVIDCTMNAYAALITASTKHFSTAEAELGLTVFTPQDFVTILNRHTR